MLGLVDARNLLVKILGEVRDLYAFSLVGYVVMPEHIQLLVSEPAKGTPSTVMQVLKQKVSRGYSDHSSLRFWQLRFYDFMGAGSTWNPPEKRVESEKES